MHAGADDGGVTVTIADEEEVLRRAEREIAILVARDEVTITHARFAGGQRVAGPHIHHEHTDAFYVLDGELTFEIGREAETITVSAGGLVAAPPGVAHSFHVAGDGPARWLTIHAPDGGFAAFMRGVRDGVEVEWDIAAVPAGGGLPAGEAIVSHDAGERPRPAGRECRLRCALPGLDVVEWRLRAPQPDLRLRRGGRDPAALFVVDGELQATLAGTARTVGAGTAVSVPPGAELALSHRGPGSAGLLGLHLRRPSEPRAAADRDA